MSISERPADAQIELYSGVASLELSVVAADFTTVASGLGNLSTAVPPGIYQVVVRAGPVIDRTLITVGPGETYRANNLSVRFPAPAPVSDTSTSHEYHQAAVEQASGKLGQMPGPPSGLVLVVRDVRGMEGPPLLPTDLACFSLLDEHLNPLPGFDQGWQLQSHEAIATWSGRLAAGGYALRTDPRLLVGGERMPTTSQIFDQSIWLSDNWQTIVFITTGQGGPQTSAASIHMGQLGIGWSPFDTQVGLALELANWGLREGRSVVPNDLLNVLLNSKYVNPMLGIVGAHSLLLSSEVNWDVVETVIHNLELLVPGHPDVIALRWMAARGRAAAGMAAPPPTAPAAPAVPAVPAVPVGSASWPPMLLSSYRALIAMDAVDCERDRQWLTSRAGCRAAARPGHLDELAADRDRAATAAAGNPAAAGAGEPAPAALRLASLASRRRPAAHFAPAVRDRGPARDRRRSSGPVGRQAGRSGHRESRGLPHGARRPRGGERSPGALWHTFAAGDRARPHVARGDRRSVADLDRFPAASARTDGRGRGRCYRRWRRDLGWPWRRVRRCRRVAHRRGGSHRLVRG